MNKNFLIPAGVAIVIIAAGIYFFNQLPSTNSPLPTPTVEQKTVKLYYYDPAKDRDETGNVMCSRNGLEAVERKVPVQYATIPNIIRLLLRGELTGEEKTKGITTEYPLPGLELVNTSFSDGTLTLEFNDPMNKTGGGSCRVGILWFQIEATAKQFPEVQNVRFLPEELFQP